MPSLCQADAPQAQQLCIPRVRVRSIGEVVQGTEPAASPGGCTRDSTSCSRSGRHWHSTQRGRDTQTEPEVGPGQSGSGHGALQVPPELVLTAETALRQSRLGDLMEANRLPEWSALTLYLLELSRNDGRYSPFSGDG